MKDNCTPATREDILNNKKFSCVNKNIIFRLMPTTDKFGNQWIGITTISPIASDYPYAKVIKIGKKKITYFDTFSQKLKKAIIDNCFLVKLPIKTILRARPIKVVKRKPKIYED